MRHILCSMLLLLLVAFPSEAQEFPLVQSKIDLADGDTFVFLGDSITHQCLYTQYVEDYYYTRYPDRHIRFHNAGVGGDTAADALDRFDEDVAAFKPKYVSILLGMNDGRYGHFDHDVFKKYETDMTTLLDRITATGSTPIPIGPTMYDARATLLGAKKASRDEPRFKYYDSVLAFFGTWLQQQAVDRGVAYVDMFNPLHQLTRIQRETDPRFTMIPGAVHPDPNGHAVMAFALLEDTHAARNVCSINAVWRGKKWNVSGPGGKFTDASGSDQQLAFSCRATSLPWIVPEEAQLGYQLAHAGHKLSNERLRVVGLVAGTYELKIDDQVVGQYGYLQLARGIELQGNSKTPQYQQALRVALLNKQRNEDAVHLLRNQWRDLKMQRRKLTRWVAAHPDDEAGAKKQQAAFTEWQEPFRQRVAELLDKIRQYDDQIHAANQPPVRAYVLQRVEPKTATPQ